ncbi:hypothetical protein MPTK1_8g04160 [Marchantia polymorpha subsp. ruderalis]|uniref:Uncharacterized protein n=1 Tax=Marchantia polymorpha TaxID=3197 RepID=A0A2R6XJR9_MARPO|nr:hypothetical protein MARPO_0012s0205 [Marchantia polymorpha]BBN18639.1 hypothetical protein Mp_8g04160 [Marchantia polymorpha subsp. ruderalis]|eukprot:PTQ46286.1 hypothetical protein MARPO_0012s0205 [Marchantia polymorpha]
MQGKAMLRSQGTSRVFAPFDCNAMPADCGPHRRLLRDCSGQTDLPLLPELFPIRARGPQLLLEGDRCSGEEEELEKASKHIKTIQNTTIGKLAICPRGVMYYYYCCCCCCCGTITGVMWEIHFEQWRWNFNSACAQHSTPQRWMDGCSERGPPHQVWMTS